EAAEAAISNPLLDDVSMKGAQGVLISISGGRNDMTLFEVDEAATRIRSEVDADANIILGATFEDDLDGVIRVSVVATGIGDEVERLIADDPRIVSFAKKSAPEEIVEEDVIEAVEEAPEQEPMRVNSDLSEVEHTLFDGVYETSETQVRVRKIAPGAQMPKAPRASQPVEEAEVDPAQPFIPPVAAPVGQGAPRMPSVDDFPPIAQQEIVAKTAQKSESASEEGKKRGGFFDRLTNVGLGLKERSLRPAEGKNQEEETPVRTEPEFSGKPMSAEQGSVEMPRRLGETLKQMAAREPDEERLEIPAFLRRQAN
ncbi:MAG TPA: cell division protein FtsZ, partial [Rhizobiales bacterium]|nr:cell division protein FtsZ [Hyphomicrobiales bacterium]